MKSHNLHTVGLVAKGQAFFLANSRPEPGHKRGRLVQLYTNKNCEGAPVKQPVRSAGQGKCFVDNQPVDLFFDAKHLREDIEIFIDNLNYRFE